MNESLLDLSRKIDGITVGLLEMIADVAESLHTPFFVVGVYLATWTGSRGSGQRFTRRQRTESRRLLFP